MSQYKDVINKCWLNSKNRKKLLSDDTQKKILIYGKGIANNQYVITNLKAKYTVWFADALPEVVKLASGHHVDLTLFELSKNSKNRLSTLRKLRSLRPEVMILVMLDNKSTKEVAKILSYGVTDVFLNPFDPQLLVERVEALLKKN